MIAYLDIDGVLANFNEPACKIINVDYPPLEWHWYKDIPNGFERVNGACDIDFWINLNWLPDGKEILATVKCFG